MNLTPDPYIIIPGLIGVLSRSRYAVPLVAGNDTDCKRGCVVKPYRSVGLLVLLS